MLGSLKNRVKQPELHEKSTRVNPPRTVASQSFVKGEPPCACAQSRVSCAWA
jgi:hypothetical protein